MNKTRPKQLSFRVSEEEYQQLQEKISESGKNQQEYILSCVLEKQIVNTDGIKELIPELKRIGNNLNQIAKRCNEGGMLPSEAEVRKHGEELNKVYAPCLYAWLSELHALSMPLYALPARQRSCEPAPGLFPRPHGRIVHNAYRLSLIHI